jgi:hypothetical protein
MIGYIFDIGSEIRCLFHACVKVGLQLQTHGLIYINSWAIPKLILYNHQQESRSQILLKAVRS